MNFKLRKWQIEDLEDLVKYANNKNVARFLADRFPHPYTLEDGKLFIESVLNEDSIHVFVIDVDGKAVGSIGIFPESDIHRKNAEIGYWLAQEYWGYGIMPNAIEQIVDYGFKTFDIIRIYARPFSVNKQSQSVLLKAGFTQEAILRKTIFKNNEYFDELYLSIYKTNNTPI